MRTRLYRLCLIFGLVLLGACARDIPPSDSLPDQGRSGPPVAFESRETFLDHLRPANLDLTSWNDLEPALRDSLNYVSGKNDAEPAASAPGVELTWGDLRRTLVTLIELLPRLDEHPGLLAEHFEWKAVPEGIEYSGYYEPVIRASRIRQAGFEHPVYATPPDMRLHKRRHGSYHDRKAIDGGKVLEGRGLELAWAADPVDVFYLQIQGSGRLLFEDGSTICVNYDSQNGHTYRSIGRIMRERGLIERGHILEQRAWFKANPHQVNDILFENPSYVFFKFGDKGAIGAMGYALEPWVSLATDRAFIPLGAVVAYAVNIPDPARGEAPLRAIGLAQDVGGAIKKNRIDIFCGQSTDGEYVASLLDQRGPAWVLTAKAPAPEAPPPAEPSPAENDPASPGPTAPAVPASGADAPEEDAAAIPDPVAEARAATIRKDYAAARRLLEQPAREGDAAAEDMLGHMLLFGRGGPVDAGRAEELLRRAAEKGRPEAQNSMGVLYMTGVNGRIDPLQGIDWFRKAAENGHAYAMFNMGRAAEQGLGMERSSADALAWYAQAAHKGSEAARIRLEELRDAQAPPNKKRNMAYFLDDRTQSRRVHRRSDAASEARSDDAAKTARMEVLNADLKRSGQSLTLTCRLVNRQPGKPCRGELRLSLLLPDDSRTPLEAPDTSYAITKFVDKKLLLALPEGTPDGARLLIEALADGSLLHASRLAVPRS